MPNSRNKRPPRRVRDPVRRFLSDLPALVNTWSLLSRQSLAPTPAPLGEPCDDEQPAEASPGGRGHRVTTSDAGPVGQRCRLCGAADLRSVLDLGATPPCELFLTESGLDEPEMTYPLHLRICAELPAAPDPRADHARGHVHRLRLPLLVLRLLGAARPPVRRRRHGARGLGADSFVVEVASNDGYLLQHVVADEIRCLGIEPSVNVSRGGPQGRRPDADRLPLRGDGRERSAPSTARPTWWRPTTSTRTSPT